MNPDLTIIGCFIASFIAVTLFVWFGFQLFGKGWQSYEEKYVKGAERTLDAMYLTMPAQHIIYLSFASMAVGFGLIMLALRHLTLAVIVALIAFPMPGLIVQLLKKRRDKLFNRQLVDALVAMGNALRAGFSLPLAFELLAREMPNPMGQEMRLLTQQMRVGVTMEDALRELYRRMPSEDLDLLISSILISREVGGNLTEIFDNIADTVRERHRLEGKIASLTAQGKLQGLVVAMLPVGIGIFMYVFNPTLMEPMFQHWLGIIMMVVTGILIVIGTFFIYKVTKIDI